MLRSTFLFILPCPPRSPFFPYTTLFRSLDKLGFTPEIYLPSNGCHHVALFIRDINVEPVQVFVSVGRCGTRSQGTRLNSSHVAISYAVFCLKKKRGLRIGIERDLDTKKH